MGNGSTADAGKLPRLKADARSICGAMAQQRRYDGRDENESVPQQFVHLVGCRDPKALPAPPPGPRSPNS